MQDNFLGASVLEKLLKAERALASMPVSALYIKNGNFQNLSVLSHKVMPEYVSGSSPPALNN